MSDTVELGAAAVAVQEARARLLSTAHQLQARLEPDQLLDEAVTGAKSGAASLARTVVETAQRRPQVAAAIVGGFVLLAARRPIGRALRRLLRRRQRDDDLRRNRDERYWFR